VQAFCAADDVVLGDELYFNPNLEVCELLISSLHKLTCIELTGKSDQKAAASRKP
jgi:hypothetical protein